MARGIHREIGLGQLAGGVDEEGIALGHLDHHPVRQGTVAISHRTRGIRQQRKGQLVFLGEGLVRQAVIHAHAHHLRTQRRELRQIVAEGAGLAGAARRIVLGIEVQHHPLPAPVGELAHRAHLVRQGKVGGGCAKGRNARLGQQGQQQDQQQKAQEFHGGLSGDSMEVAIMPESPHRTTPKRARHG